MLEIHSNCPNLAVICPTLLCFVLDTLSRQRVAPDRSFEVSAWYTDRHNEETLTRLQASTDERYVHLKFDQPRTGIHLRGRPNLKWKIPAMQR